MTKRILILVYLLFFFVLPGHLEAQATWAVPWSTTSVIAGGSVTAPGVGAAIATIASASLPAGNYELIVTAGYGATPGALNNMELRRGATVIGSLYVPAVANREIQVVVRRFLVDGTQTISINATAAAGAGEVYNAHIIATRTN